MSPQALANSLAKAVESGKGDVPFHIGKCDKYGNPTSWGALVIEFPKKDINQIEAMSGERIYEKLYVGSSTLIIPFSREINNRELYEEECEAYLRLVFKTLPEAWIVFDEIHIPDRAPVYESGQIYEVFDTEPFDYSQCWDDADEMINSIIEEPAYGVIGDENGPLPYEPEMGQAHSPKPKQGSPAQADPAKITRESRALTPTIKMESHDGQWGPVSGPINHNSKEFEANIDYTGITKEEADIANSKLNNMLRKRKVKNKETGEMEERIIQDIDNALLILKNDIRLQKLGWRKLPLDADIRLGDVPWRKFNPKSPNWDDSDDHGIRQFMWREWGFNAEKTILQAVDLYFLSREYHPVENYILHCNELDGEAYFADKDWDWTEVFLKGLGAQDVYTTEKEQSLIRSMTQLWLEAAVGRVLHPGMKFDHIINFQGTEGLGKTAILYHLVPDEEWVVDMSTIEGNKAVEDALGAWITVLDELKAYNKADDDAFKTWVTKKKEKARLAYRKNPKIYYREHVSAASTNDNHFIKGDSKARRFWPIQCTANHLITFDEIDEARDYIWSCAVHAFLNNPEHKRGRGFDLTPEEEKLADKIRAQFRVLSPLDEKVEEYTEMLFPENWDKLSKDEQYDWYNSPEYQKNNPGVMKRYSFSAAEFEENVIKVSKQDPDFEFAELATRSTNIRRNAINAAYRKLGFVEGKRVVTKYGRVALFTKTPEE